MEKFTRRRSYIALFHLQVPQIPELQVLQVATTHRWIYLQVMLKDRTQLRKGYLMLIAFHYEMFKERLSQIKVF